MSKAKGSPIGEEMIRGMEELVATLETGGMAAAEKRFTVRRVPVIAGPPELSTDDVKAARAAVGMSQTAFARFLGVSAQLVRGWEQGTRRPVGAARRLLADMRQHPRHWREQGRAAVGSE
jgi:DNA-binding transcriptional regulator YiaG